SPLIAALDLELRVLTVKLQQACTGVRQADAATCARVPRQQPRPIVLHSKPERLADFRGGNEDASGGRASLDAVSNGVFHERLQDQLRHPGVLRRRVSRD